MPDIPLTSSMEAVNVSFCLVVPETAITPISLIVLVFKDVIFSSNPSKSLY